MELRGVRALVTGASRGIGRAIALALASEGAACVGIGYLSMVKLARRVAQEIEAAGSRAILLPGDIRVQEHAEGIVHRFITEAGGIDVLVNNAGQPAPGYIYTIAPEEWDRALSLHVSAPFWSSRVAVETMMLQRSGRILNISSLAARRGVAGAVAYCTAKSAVIGFTRSLARELVDYGILVNALAPGIVDTDFHAEDTPEFRQNATENRIPLHRYGTAAEIAQAALFVLRHDYVTGEVLAVDGGLGMRVA